MRNLRCYFVKKQSRDEAYYGFGETQGGHRYIRLAYAWQGGFLSEALFLFFKVVPFLNQLSITLFNVIDFINDKIDSNNSE
jgi:hypothetical protein